MSEHYRFKLQRYDQNKLTYQFTKKIDVWDLQDIVEYHKSRSKKWKKLVHADPRNVTYEFTYSLAPELKEVLQFIYFPSKR